MCSRMPERSRQPRRVCVSPLSPPVQPIPCASCLQLLPRPLSQHADGRQAAAILDLIPLGQRYRSFGYVLFWRVVWLPGMHFRERACMASAAPHTPSALGVHGSRTQQGNSYFSVLPDPLEPAFNVKMSQFSSHFKQSPSIQQSRHSCRTPRDRAAFDISALRTKRQDFTTMDLSQQEQHSVKHHLGNQ